MLSKIIRDVAKAAGEVAASPLTATKSALKAIERETR